MTCVQNEKKQQQTNKKTKQKKQQQKQKKNKQKNKTIGLHTAMIVKGRASRYDYSPDSHFILLILLYPGSILKTEWHLGVSFSS